MSTWMSTNYPSVMFINDPFSFNGDDALEVIYGGNTTDVFGSIGLDPGTSWSGNGVSTADSNIGLLSSINSGSLTGFTDPSTRFEVIESDPAILTGFGLPPSGLTIINNPTLFSASVISDTQIDLSFNDNVNGDSVAIVFDTDNTFVTPNGTVSPVGNAFAGGTVLSLSNGSGTYNHTGLDPNTTY